MDKKILKSLLKYDFWSDQKNKLVASLFEDEVRELFEIIETSHDQHKVDIPVEALVAMWTNKNPVATRAELGVIESLVEELKVEEELPEELTAEIIEGLWKRNVGRRIANLGINIAEGQDEAFEKLKAFMNELDDGFAPDDFPEPITDDLDELLALVSNKNRYAINILPVKEVLYGPGPGDFWEVFARPETGKTGFVVSLAVAPNGFCSQGAKVLYLGNEEDPRRTKLRAMMAYTGMNEAAILKNPKKVKEEYQKIASQFIMQDISGWDTVKVAAYISKIAPDIVIIDQLDKVAMAGTYDKTVDKLRDLYIWARAVANIQRISIFAVSQASADAHDRTVLTPDMMENSKTGKFAEADVIIGIGKYPLSADGSQDPMRFLTIGKNKVSGYHGTIPCRIEADVSRYVG